MKKILIIEDEPNIRSNIEQILRLADYEPMVAVDGQEGLELAKQIIPDLILCDVVMPKMDGYEVVKKVRENEETALIPFIFLTAKVDKIDIRQGIESGGDDYLTKPFSPEELLGAVEACLKKQEKIQSRHQKEIDQMCKAISSTLSHEINTPLNGIMLSAEILKNYYESLDKEEIEEITENFLISGRRLENLTKNFLLYSSLELITKNPLKLTEIRQNIRPARTKNLLTSISLEKAEEYQRIDDLESDIDEEIVEISGEHLDKMMRELMDNAFKFSPSHTSVKVKTKIYESKFHLFISNEGRGFSPEQLKKIGPYMQFERKVYEQQGAGLGLPIVQKILEIYQGKLTINSVIGKETTIHIILPVSKVSSEDFAPTLF